MYDKKDNDDGDGDDGDDDDGDDDDGDDDDGDDDDDIAMTTMEIRSLVRMNDWRSYLDQNVDELRRLS